MANLQNLLASGRVNGVLLSKEGTKDINLGFPEGDFEVKFMGVLDDSSAYAAYLKKSSMKEGEYQARLAKENVPFFWAAMPFAGWAIAARQIETKRGVAIPYAKEEGNELWHAYAVAAPSFVKGCPDLGSKDAQDEELGKDLAERSSFFISHEMKEVDGRKKHVFRPL